MREIQDHYFREAKKVGYVARSAFKLLEIQERKRLIKRGDRVLDLGCAPGAWLQVACSAIGPRSAGGIVIGIDIAPTKVPAKYCDDRVKTLQADAFNLTIEDLSALAGTTFATFDVILSDMMSSTSGHGHSDHHDSINLARQALSLAQRALRPGGHLVVKVFEGEAYNEFLKDCAASFTHAKGFKPKASRDESREMYVICENYHSRSNHRIAAP